MKQGLECIVSIEGYSKQGIAQGVTPALGKKVEVRGAYLGEQVVAEVMRKKQGVHQARLLEVLQAHPCRVEPRCLHAGVCGGCSWQTLDYKQQCLYKQEKIKTLFSPFQAECFPLISMEDPWSFRNKMEFSFYEDQEGPALGLIMGGTKGKVVALQQCHLVRPWMVEVLQSTSLWWKSTGLKAYHRRKNTGTLQTLTLREGMNTGDKLVMLTVSGEPCAQLTKQVLEQYTQSLLQVLGGKVSIFLQIKLAKPGMVTQYNEMLLHGEDHIQEKMTIAYPSGEQKTYTFKISPSSFFQPNTLQAEKLFSRALAMVSPGRKKLILDLYCGTGTLGMIFAPLAEQVIGVELNPYAVFDAEANLEANSISHMKVIQEDMNKVSLPQETVDLVMIDPPRAGLGAKVVAKIAALQPQEILYVSCNPYTQWEDVKEFLEKGYELVAVQPVDQFPHGPHLENIAVLRKMHSIHSPI